MSGTTESSKKAWETRRRLYGPTGISGEKKMSLKDLAICPEPGAIEAIQKAFDTSAHFRAAPYFNAKAFYRRLVEQGFDVVAEPPRTQEEWRAIEGKLLDALKILRVKV